MTPANWEWVSASSVGTSHLRTNRGCDDAGEHRNVSDTDRVAIVVEDDGPGIPQQEHEKVFAPFYRLGPARDPDKAGVGLGLSIARTIAREHGGDVTLANCDGGGLSVRFKLPARQVEK